MKLSEIIFIASLVTLIVLVGGHAYELVSTATLVVGAVLCTAFGLSAVIKIYSNK